MNAAIALCHFCEAHGPCAIFCTQTLRETKLEDLSFENQIIANKLCSACNSLGEANVICSKDEQSGATFLSTQIPALPNVADLVKQASVRSLSCEINCQKDGGFVYFGDSSRGHVLSHTFHVSDLQARGFYQLFSIIVLMKDKYFLLNTKPFFAEHLKKISSEIQNSAQKIRKEEEAKGSPRQRRLLSSQLLVQTPRSLVELTGEKNIFAVLHSHFSWILLAGSRFLTEHMPSGNLPWHHSTSDMEYLSKPLPNLLSESDDECITDSLSLRHVKEILKSEFPALCYCFLTGIKIIVRGFQTKTNPFLLCLMKLLPESMHRLIQLNSDQFITKTECKAMSVSVEVPVPMASATLLRIDFLEEGNAVSMKWLGEIPSKLPDLLMKIIKAVDEPNFTESVLDKQIRVLVEEWKNKIICLSRVKSSSGLGKLKKVLGVQQQDQHLINYWSLYLEPK